MTPNQKAQIRAQKRETTHANGLSPGVRVTCRRWPDWRGEVTEVHSAAYASVLWTWSSHGTRVEPVAELIPVQD